MCRAAALLVGYRPSWFGVKLSMARQEQDREDLLRDGKQMRLRAECTIDDVVVVIGFRPEGQVSVYVGADPVFQFNRALELRRVFLNGKRYAAIQGKLCELTRSESSDRVRFSSQAILAEVEGEIRAALEFNVGQIQLALESPGTAWRLAGGDFLDFRKRLSDWLAIVLDNFKIAETPNV